MNILITNSTCLQDIKGGASRAVHEIASYFSEEGNNKVVVFVPSRIKKQNNIGLELTVNGYYLYRYLNFSGFLRPLNIITANIAFWQLNRKQKFDIIWGNSPEPWLYIKFWKFGKKLYSMHGPWLLESELDGRTNKLRRLAIKFIYNIIITKNTVLHFQSKYVKDACINESKSLNKCSKIIISPILIDEGKLTNIRYSQYSNLLNYNKINILIARRLVNRTGVLEFINSFSKFTEKFRKNYNILIVGTGYLYEKLLESVQELEEIKILGEIPQADLDYLYGACDVVLMPSLAAEGFGVSILEAIFRNTPVIYTSGGGMDEFLNPILPNLKYDFNDTKQLQRILCKLIYLKSTSNLNVDKSKIKYNFKCSIKKIISQ